MLKEDVFMRVGVALFFPLGKKLPQIGHYSIVGIVDKIDENNRFSFNSIRLSFILELAEIISLSLLLST